MIKEHDRGLCDLRIYGKGMSIYLDVEPGVPVATPEKPVAHTLGTFWLCVSGCGRSVHGNPLTLCLRTTQTSSKPRPRSTA